MSVNWLKYKVKLAPVLEELFSAELAQTPYTLGWIEPGIELIRTDNGYAYREKADVPLTVYLFEQLTGEEESHVLRLQQYLQQHWGEQASLAHVELMSEADESWREQFVPVQVGEWLIAPSWCAEAAQADDPRVLWIDPGAAFGTGYHETTQDILQMLQALPLTGKRVLDIGAGSGILSVFCAKNGAAWPVYAVDIDPSAARQIAHNGSLNGLPQAAVEVVLGDPREAEVQARLPHEVDLILINIGADEDVAMLPIVLRCLAADGLVILSGIVSWSRERVKKAYRKAGFCQFWERTSGEWVTLAVRMCDNGTKE